FLLNGTVQKVGDQLKVTTALIDGRDGKNAWSTVFERRLADVFAVQSEIAGAVARELSVTIDERQDGKKEKQVGGTDSLAAFDAYLRGRDLFDAHVDEASDRAALAKFEQAIALDENYAAARAARSRSLAVIANQYASAGQRRMLYDEAIAEADRATKLAPDYAYGFIALGYAIFYGRLQAREARPSYEQAIKLGGGDVDVLSRYALYCARTGRFAEADSTIARAAALDPLNASMFKSAGNIKYAARSYSEAIDYARKALEISPKRATLRGDMGNAFLMMGNLDAAEAEFKLETNNLLALPGLAIVAHRRGNAKAADAAFAALIGEYGDIGLYQQAQVLAQRAQTEAAFTTLDKARADSDSGLVYLLNDPLLDPIRSDQRFNILLHRFGFA
ncbi:MAG: tetratricopeptide repeat protein, partial [Novosphingobium sp.]